MAYITIKEYKEANFTEQSRPDSRTVIAWIKKGIIIGRKIGTRFYVEVK